MKTLVKIFCMMLPLSVMGQSYTDYLGAGHNIGMTVTASSSNAKSPAENTLSGKGMDSPTFAAGRFLSHATMAPTPEMIEDLVATGNDYEAWIDNQFAMPSIDLTPKVYEIWDEIIDYRVSQGENEDDIFGPYKPHFDYAWHETIILSDYHLRHKVAYALSQILVVSDNSDLTGWAESLSGYYDILQNHAFGNYRDLLEEVSYSTQMGYYLSHINNAKANAEANTSPDENYAREIMQLFSIGLYELNTDGTRKTDGSGNYIPTYDQDDIQEFAKIFTGLGIGELEDPNNWPYQPFFGLDMWAAKKDAPMVMYQNFHETESKTLLGGQIVPANQTGEQDLDDAFDNLFNHPNVGPFIGSLMIKRLVKSNPSPAYVERVAMAFNDNGSGVRGDMKALIKAILLDPEARDGEAMFETSAGKVREPVLKFFSLVNSIPVLPGGGKYWNISNGYKDATGQAMFGSPTVFNFYSPDFLPVGDLSAANLTAPELKLHNTSTSINYMNAMYAFNYWDWDSDLGMHTGNISILYHWENSQTETPFPSVLFDQNYFLQYADDPELLVNELDKRFTYGQLTDETRDIILPVIHDLKWNWNDAWRLERVKSAIYLILISPDYNIMK